MAFKANTVLDLLASRQLVARRAIPVEYQPVDSTARRKFRTMLDLQKTYNALLQAARDRRLIGFEELAQANEVEYKKARGQVRKHIAKLTKLGHELGWPLLSAVAVENADQDTGALGGSALKDFLAVARMTGADINDPSAFLANERAKVFDWARTAPEEPDLETAGGPRFVEYFGPVLESLQALGGSGTPERVSAWIKENKDIPTKELHAVTRGGNPQIQDKINWARFYLVKAGLIDASKRGLWSLTEEGHETILSREQAIKLFREIKRQFQIAPEEEDATPDSSAPNLFDDRSRQFWFVGATWEPGGDQSERFLSEGVWQNGYEDRHLAEVERMRPGDRIAIKSAFTRKHAMPFDNGGKPVSCMRIKAIGTVTENLGDGRTVKVDWQKLDQPRDWYFYTYRTTVLEADPNDDLARRLILFAFAGEDQDYRYWITEVPYFAKKYGAEATRVRSEETFEEEPETEREAAYPSYTTAQIEEDGCFLASFILDQLVERVKAKKNLVLQGPPGTGKTWLAKRLAYALIGSKDPKLTRHRLRMVQFHPSYSYEDFVCGWRPKGAGGLALVNGIFLEFVEAAKAEPDRPFVLVIEEINRGNPAQIFGEMLTLLENSKRNREDAIELAYHTDKQERVYVPRNLHVIGTMNIADRSLALVDLALRRRFAFVNLEPLFNERWSDWCAKQCGFPIDVIVHMREKMTALNEEIGLDRSLGMQFRIGHSYVTPPADSLISDPKMWFKDVVETEILPLLEEYWFDAPEKVTAAARNLLKGH